MAADKRDEGSWAEPQAFDEYDCDPFSWAEDKKMLAEHGLISWPSDRELTRKVCDVEDGILVLARALGWKLIKDIHGNWIAFQPPRGGE